MFAKSNPYSVVVLLITVLHTKYLSHSETYVKHTSRFSRSRKRRSSSSRSIFILHIIVIHCPRHLSYHIRCVVVFFSCRPHLCFALKVLTTQPLLTTSESFSLRIVSQEESTGSTDRAN